MIKLLRMDSTMVAATFGVTALMASQVAAKAMRDAFFLSQFGVTALPGMVIVASLLSIVASVITARLGRSMLPTRILPHIFVASSALLFADWWIFAWSPASGAVLIYVEITVMGSLLISSFWSLLDDRFDPRSAKKQFGKIVAAGTLGGVIGGLLAARVGSTVALTTMLPGLAVLHLLCAFVSAKLISNPQRTVTRYSASSKAKADSGFDVVRTVPYVRNLARLILTSTMGAVLLDYVFKARVAEAYSDGHELVRFFALFYTTVGIATFFVQTILSRVAVDKLGIAGAVSSLPFSLAIGSLGAIILPGLSTAFAMRGGEAMVRSSLFKSSYEMLYAAIPRRERQATKSLLDVGVERFGDLLGALLLGTISRLMFSESTTIILGAAAFLGVLGFAASRRLRDGYVLALENSLLNRTNSVRRPAASSKGTMETVRNLSIVRKLRKETALPNREPGAKAGVVRDSIVQQIEDLRSSDAEAVRNILRKPLDALLAPPVIALLAWDDVAADAIRALRTMGPKITGQLVDTLLDPNEEFAIRRRVPRVLAEFDTQRAVNGLIEGLSANRFEVRFRSAQALSRIQMRNPNVVMNADNITKAVERELEVNPDAWRQYRAIASTCEEPKGMITMDHVFRLLSLIYPREPLQAAHRGLESCDDHLRRTSLEYLENVLPTPVWRRMAPLFEEGVPLAVAG